MADALTVRDLTLSFGGIVALDHVDLSLEAGSIGGLIGPNGAGKTSLLNCVCRFYQPQQGRILLGNLDVSRQAPHQLAHHGLARTFQHTELFRAMTVLDNVLVGAHTRGRPSAIGDALRLPAARRAATAQMTLARGLLERFGLTAQTAARAGALPLGLQKRVGLARALASRPSLILLDEPAAGLNPSEKREMAALLKRLREDFDLTLLLIDHDMDLVMGLCDQVTVLDFGRRIACGPPKEIQRDPRVLAAYLGAQHAPTLGPES
ncbi:MAG TPA: ABC transporter ATP-binding protein [Chloroflexota bacterium]